MSKTISEKLVEIAENEQKVYEAGHDAGYTEGLNKGGYADGFEEGKKAEYDAFWDALQEGGERIDYGMAFCGSGWTDVNYKPKYPLKPQNANYMFRGGKMTDVGEVDFKTNKNYNYFGMCRDCTNLKKFDNYVYTTLNSWLINIGEIFYKCESLKSIKGIEAKEELAYDNGFVNCYELEDISFDGTIGQNINFQWSTKLSGQSIKNIIEHLSDTASGKTLTLSRTAVDNADFGGGDTVYMSTDDPFGSYLLSNPIPLSKGQRIKIDAEWEDGHGFYDDTSSVAWWFDSTGDTTEYDNATGTPGQTLPRFYTATSDKQVVYGWYFYSNSDVSNIPIKIRAVLVDEDGNELTGENLHSFVSNTVTNGNGTTLTIAEESWETLKNSKPNWTISLV